MQLLQKLIEAAEPLVVTLIGLLFAWLANEVRAKVHSTRVQGVLLRLSDLALTVTNELEQTVVSAIKNANPGQPLDAGFAEQIKQSAIAKVKEHMGPKGCSEVLNVFGYKSAAELEALIASKIESAIAERRQFGPITGVVGQTDPVSVKA